MNPSPNPRAVGKYLAALLAAPLAAAATPARAESYVETFSDPLNPAIWQVTTGGNELSVTDGELVFTRQASDSGRLRFVPELIGDFDVSFHYRLINWPVTYAFGDRLQLSVYNLPSEGHAIGRQNEGDAHFGILDGSVCCSAYPSGTSGALRITRAEGLVTLWYDAGSGWQNMGQTTDPRDMTLDFTAYTWNGFVAGTSYAIDDFSIWAEGFSQPVPEPAAGAMLAAGLATLGWMMRRRRPLPAA
ncbi:PEP-CTERM sorting domain-containing protein [Methyloversatilis discipulorum]|uniref:PEP-CTERM sorting domain-containing protein n=1 Tax=Methyloversatilis discipulorum TaxID=1119528 RepID=UPI0026D083CB